MFDPVQCVATPLDTRSGQPRPSYERSFVAVTDTGGAGPDRPDNQISSDRLRPGKKSCIMVSCFLNNSWLAIDIVKVERRIFCIEINCKMGSFVPFSHLDILNRKLKVRS